MSHTATVEIELKDREALAAACEALGLTYHVGDHSVSLFSGSVKADFSVTLPGWRYPIAIKGNKISYDNYNGAWGKIQELEKLQDRYSREIVVKQAQSAGMTFSEDVGEDGEITLTLYDYST